jgi:hypothetical protein
MRAVIGVHAGSCSQYANTGLAVLGDEPVKRAVDRGNRSADATRAHTVQIWARSGGEILNQLVTLPAGDAASVPEPVQDLEFDQILGSPRRALHPTQRVEGAELRLQAVLELERHGVLDQVLEAIRPGRMPAAVQVARGGDEGEVQGRS